MAETTRPEVQAYVSHAPTNLLVVGARERSARQGHRAAVGTREGRHDAQRLASIPGAQILAQDGDVTFAAIQQPNQNVLRRALAGTAWPKKSEDPGATLSSDSSSARFYRIYWTQLRDRRVQRASAAGNGMVGPPSSWSLRDQEDVIWQAPFADRPRGGPSHFSKQSHLSLHSWNTSQGIARI